MKALGRLAALALLATAVAGCSYNHLYGEQLSGADLDARRHVHIVHHKDRVAGMIGRRLSRAGYKVTYGAEGKRVPKVAQAVVQYEDHWTWDGAKMSMYLFPLRIDFRDPVTNELLASGQSYRNTGGPAPEFIVDQTLSKILVGR